MLLIPFWEVSCPFGRMEETDKAPPLPSLNKTLLSSHPEERDSQIPEETVTS